MTLNFVHYSPKIDPIESDYAENKKKIIDLIGEHVREAYELNNHRGVREAHAKSYGLVRAQFEILPNLPKPYAQGIYHQPGVHDAVIRFSNASNLLGADPLLGGIVGMGIKIFGIKGKKFLDDQQPSTTFDYNLANSPTFFANTSACYLFLIQCLSKAAKTSTASLTKAQLRSAKRQLFYTILTQNGSLPPEKWLWDELLTILQIPNIQYTNLLLNTFWSMGVFRHGDYIAKVRATPAKAYSEKIAPSQYDPHKSQEFFRPPLIAELKQNNYEFDLQVQLSVDLEEMPINELTLRWSEDLSPFVTVAKIKIPKQDISHEDNLQKAESLSFNPWRVTEDHQPLGNVMRLRKDAYIQSSTLRHTFNSQPLKEPGSIQDVFG